MTRRDPTDEELALWRLIAAGARPLKSRRKRKAPAKSSPTAQSAGPASAGPAPRTPPRSSPKPQPAPGAETVLAHGHAPGMDRRQADRFLKGKMTIDGRLDLHGHTQAEAHDRLLAFLRRAHERGGRCMLIITGKGMTGGTAGVLRQAVPRWLNEPAFRRLVLAFGHARMKDGGEGALYVLLKRAK